MTNEQTVESYSRFAVALHWTVAALMLANLAIGWIGEEMERGPEKLALFQWHMSLGLLVLLLSAMRLVWRWIEPPPPPLTPIAWEAKLAKAVHAALLAITLLGPLTGIAAQLAEGRPLTFFGLQLARAEMPASPFAVARADEDHAAQPELSQREADEGGERGAGEELFKGMHALLVKPALLLLLFLHVGGALKHHFIDRDATLLRMLGRRPRAVALKSPMLP